MITNKKRDILPDFAKGFAILFMIQVHIMELFIYPNELSFIQKISMFLGGPPVAPVFMFIMGYFLYSSKVTSKKLIIRGYGLIIIGFLINIGINLNLFYHYFFKSYQIEPMNFFFGVDILFLAGLSIIIIAIIKLIKKSEILIFLILIILVLFFNHFFLPPVFNSTFLKYLFAYIWSNESWSYFPLIPWIIYPVAGYLYRALITEKIKSEILKYRYYIISVWVIFIIITFSYSSNISFYLSVYYHHNILFVFYNFCFLLGYFLFLNEIIIFSAKSAIVKLICWCGSQVTSMYIIQWLIIGNIATFIYQTQKEIYFLPLVFLTLFIVYLINKIIIKFGNLSTPIKMN